MSILHETLIQPTGIEHSTLFHFTGKYTQYITTIGNQLTCYDVTPNGLIIRLKETVQGSICQIESIDVGGTPLLIILMKEAKVSVLKYDEESNQFVIHSLHCFEDPKNTMLYKNVTPTTNRPPKMIVDKRGRCISLLCYDRLLWVIPLMTKQSSKTIDLSEYNISRVIDVIALENYELPTLAFVHAKVPTWGGRVINTGMYTNELSIITLNTELQDTKSSNSMFSSLTFKFEHIPFDTLSIIDCHPLNGVIVLTATNILYISTTSSESFCMPITTYLEPIYDSLQFKNEMVDDEGENAEVKDLYKQKIELEYNTEKMIKVKSELLIKKLVKQIYKITPFLYILFNDKGDSYYLHLIVNFGIVENMLLTAAPFKFLCNNFQIYEESLLFVSSNVHDSYIYNCKVVPYGSAKIIKNKHTKIDYQQRTKEQIEEILSKQMDCPFGKCDSSNLRIQELELGNNDSFELDKIVTVSNIHDYVITDRNDYLEMTLCSGLEPFGKIMYIEPVVKYNNEEIKQKGPEWFLKANSIVIKENEITMNGKKLQIIKEIGNVSGVKEYGKYHVIKNDKNTFFICDISKDQILEKVNQIDYFSMIIDGDNYTSIKLINGLIMKENDYFGEVGNGYANWTKCKEENKKENSVNDSQYVISFEITKNKEGRNDIIIITKDGSLHYYRELSSNKYQRLKVQLSKPITEDGQKTITINPQIVPIGRNNKKHFFVCGSAPFFIEYMFGYPVIVPFIMKNVKEMVPLSDTKLYIETSTNEEKKRMNVMINDEIINRYYYPLRTEEIDATPHHLVSYQHENINKMFMTTSKTVVLDTPDTPPPLPQPSKHQNLMEKPPTLYSKPFEGEEVYMEQYQLRELNSKSVYEFEKGEFLGNIQKVNLEIHPENENKTHKTKFREYLAICINKQTTEDSQSKGFVHLMDLDSQLDSYQHEHIEILNGNDLKKSVSYVLSIGGFLVVAASYEIQFYEIKSVGKEFTKSKKFFSDINIMVKSINYDELSLLSEDGKKIESYLITVSDLYRSTALLLFMPKKEGSEENQLVTLGRDGRTIHAIDSMLITNSEDMQMIVEFDFKQNLSVLKRMPAETERICIFEVLATFNLGYDIIKFTRVKCNVKRDRNCQVYFYITVQGSVGYLSYIKENEYSPLEYVNDKMNKELKHFAGCNPQEYRFEKGYEMGYGIRKNRILDGDLMKTFFQLNTEDKKKVLLKDKKIEYVTELLRNCLKHSSILQK